MSEIRIPLVPIETVPDGYLSQAAAEKLIAGALTALGVELGAYDRRIVSWQAGWDGSTVVTLLSWLHRAAAAQERLEARMNAQPADLSEAQLDALAAAGNKAVNDDAHDDLCACDAWPEQCVSSTNYFFGSWDTATFHTGLPAVIGLWEAMRAGPADELARLRARIAELEADR